MTESLGGKDIYQLIAELCPNGVGHRELGLAMYPKTKSIAFDKVDANAFVTTENLLADRGGVRFPAEKPKSGSFKVFAPGDILVSNIRPYLRKLWMSDRLGATSGGDVYIVRASDVPGLSSRFLYHCLAGSKFFDYATAHSGGGKMPRGNKASIKKYLIPAPPLPVQEAVVAYLDRFFQLEAELEAELVHRQKQYEWYRRHLLDFQRQEVDDEGKATGVVLDYQYTDRYQARPAIETVREMVRAMCPVGVEWKNLGEICATKTGDLISKQVIAENPGEYAVINSGREALGYVSVFNTADSPLGVTSRGAGSGSITWQEGKYFRGNLNYGIVPRDSSQVSTRFIFHVLRRKQYALQSLVVAGAIPALNKGALDLLQIPVPPLAVQEAIVEILDQFDTLVTDMSAGIPAEITARRKQYEYYREQLLSFERQGEGVTADG